ncbi:uncharacterized protein TrAFT101_000609 [Trichoderma asperellum]|uniref:uncharacterized protein n=1 Tax=Trichoderma asperellum TaxID=101201 RepID=UPI0033308607|nr:hypothetical protein TrAFT101_000609 [Trichoderma asperellum]
MACNSRFTDFGYPSTKYTKRKHYKGDATHVRTILDEAHNKIYFSTNKYSSSTTKTQHKQHMKPEGKKRRFNSSVVELSLEAKSSSIGDSSPEVISSSEHGLSPEVKSSYAII